MDRHFQAAEPHIPWDDDYTIAIVVIARAVIIAVSLISSALINNKYFNNATRDTVKTVITNNATYNGLHHSWSICSRPKRTYQYHVCSD